MTYPPAWIDAAAEAAHRALDAADDGWHYDCLTKPNDPKDCYKGDYARAALVEDIIPAVLAELGRIGALAGPTPVADESKLRARVAAEIMQALAADLADSDVRSGEAIWEQGGYRKGLETAASIARGEQ